MDPSLLVPDRIVAVAADGSVGVDFDLPRFGVSLVTITPVVGASDGGTEMTGAVADVTRLPGARQLQSVLSGSLRRWNASFAKETVR